MGNDANNIFTLILGFISGSIICYYLNDFKAYNARAYATQARGYVGDDNTVINCDGPRPWNPDEIEEFKSMSDLQKKRYLVSREKAFKKLCREAADDIFHENLEQADPEQTEQTNLKYGLRKTPYIGKRKVTMRPLYPSVDTIISDNNQAAFARAYASDDVEVIDCDKPYKPSQDDIKFAQKLPPSERPKYFKSLVADMRKRCDNERKKRLGEDTHEFSPDPKFPSGAPSNTKTIYPSDEKRRVKEIYSTFARAYASGNIHVTNCDKPFELSEHDKEFVQTLSPQARAKYLKNKEKNFHSQCRIEAKRRIGDESVPDLDPAPTYPVESRGKVYNGPAFGPEETVKWGYSEYARAYAAKKKASSGGKSADTGGGSAAPSAPAAPAASGGGATPGGKLPYPTTGKSWQFKDSGKHQRNYRSGGSSGTTEWNATGMGAAANLMGVVYYTHPSSCSGGHGDEADIKMWGPTHSNSGCCWCIVNINGAGDVCTGGEGPHPTTDKCRKKVGNVGSVKGKLVGLCHVIRAGSGGAHSEVWIDVGGGFKKIGEYDGKCGSKKWSTSPSSGQQVQFRCDCSGVTIKSAVVYELAGGGGSTGGGTGGGSSAPAAPAGGKAAKKAGAVYTYAISIA